MRASRSRIRLTAPMRRTLILGGTGWVGRAIAAAMVTAGSDVTCLARGDSGPVPAGARLLPSDRSRPGAYDEVRNVVWDDVIELSYDPQFIRESTQALGASTRHWTLISSVSVYARNDQPGVDESAALVDPVDLEDYAQAKVAAERATGDVVGDKLLIARPGLIVGPGDGSDRFGYWVSRFALAHDGPVLVPTTDGRMAQLIDVEDLASWVVEAGAHRLTGAFNVVGDPLPLSDVLTAAARVAGYTGRTVAASDEWLTSNDVRYWAGPRSLPLWLPVSDAAFAERDNTAYKKAGGTARPLGETLERTLADERALGLARDRRSGLIRADELTLLKMFAQPR